MKEWGEILKSPFMLYGTLFFGLIVFRGPPEPKLYGHVCIKSVYKVHMKGTTYWYIHVYFYAELYSHVPFEDKIRQDSIRSKYL